MTEEEKKSSDEILQDEACGMIDDFSEALKKIGNRFLKISVGTVEEVGSTILEQSLAKLKDNIKK